MGLSIPAEAKTWPPYSLSAISQRVVCICFAVVALAQMAFAVSLDTINSTYTQKLEKVKSYKVEYQLETVFGDNGAGSGLKQNSLLVGEQLQFRLESAAISDTSTPSSFRRLMTADMHELRILDFDPSGKPDSGAIRQIQGSTRRFDELIFSPIGLVGLCDSSSFFRPGGSGLPYMADIRALSRKQNARLKAEPVQLGEASAYILEWPSDSPHPSHRAWLSADDDLNLLQFETYMADASGKYSMLLRTTNSDFHEVLPGLFLPKTSTFYRPPSNAVESQFMTLSAITYNFDVKPSAEEFRLTFPDGIRMTDSADGPASRAWEEFKMEISDVADYLFPSRRGTAATSEADDPRPATSVFGISTSWISLAIIIFLAFVLWLGFICVRRLLRESPPKADSHPGNGRDLNL